MARRRPGDRRGSSDGSVVDTLDTLRTELATVRRGQLKLMKAMVDLRHEVNHRLGTTRDELSELIKASHAEIARQLERLESVSDEQRSRLSELERDFDEAFDTGSE